MEDAKPVRTEVITRTVSIWRCVRCRHEWRGRESKSALGRVKAPLRCSRCRRPYWWIAQAVEKPVAPSVMVADEFYMTPEQIDELKGRLGRWGTLEETNAWRNELRAKSKPGEQYFGERERGIAETMLAQPGKTRADVEKLIDGFLAQRVREAQAAPAFPQSPS